VCGGGRGASAQRDHFLGKAELAKAVGRKERMGGSSFFQMFGFVLG